MPIRGLELDLSHLKRVGMLQTVPLYRKYIGQTDYWCNRLFEVFSFVGWLVWSLLRILVLKRPEARGGGGSAAGGKGGIGNGTGSARETVLWYDGRWYHAFYYLA